MKKSVAPYFLMGLFVLLFASWSASVRAAADGQVPILPDRGMYYTHGHGGTGLNIDVDPNGYIFASFYTYDHDGRPTFYLMEGQFQPASDIVAESSEVYRDQIGSFDATLYTSRNGECLGADCIYKNPDRALTDHKAHIVWITQRHARLTIDSQSWDLWAGEYTNADTDKIVGTWTTTLTSAYTPDGSWSSRIAILKSRKSEYPGTAFSSRGNYRIYDVACAGATDSDWNMQSVCPAFYSMLTRGNYAEEVGPSYAFVYNVTDGTMRLFPYKVVDGKPRFLDSRSGPIFQMELTPGVMRGRLIILDHMGTYEMNVGSLDMVRVPSGTFDAATVPPQAE